MAIVTRWPSQPGGRFNPVALLSGAPCNRMQSLNIVFNRSDFIEVANVVFCGKCVVPKSKRLRKKSKANNVGEN